MSKFLKAAHRRFCDPFESRGPLWISLRSYALVEAGLPAGTRLQREAISWLRRKNPALAARAAAKADASQRLLDRRAAEAVQP